MSRVLYAYFAKPTPMQVGNFLRALLSHGISISHLGKSDPPRKFTGTIDEATEIVVNGKDLTDYTFARDRVLKLDFDLQIHHDPRWTHSTVSATCPDASVLDFIADSAGTAFDLFIAVLGISGAW